MKTTIKDSNTGNPLLICDLPKDYKITASMQLISYPLNQKIQIDAQAVKGNCTIGYKTGETYLYQKQQLQPGFFANQNMGPQNESGAWYSDPISLKQQLDDAAGTITGKKLQAKDYYDLSKTSADKAKKYFDIQLNHMCEELQLGAQTSPIPVGNIFRNYLLDGGMGIYEDGKKIIAVCLYRIGFEVDFVQGQGIIENITGEPFGQAVSGPMVTSSASWSVPFIAYMISDDKEDLKTFMSFVDSLDSTKEMEAYSEQIRQQVVQYQYQQAQMETMRNQAMWNAAFAQQQQQFAAMDRLTNSLSQDLDRFHNNLNQTMAQNDMRFRTGPSSVESSDDYIQRLRHESIMGVETYERNDGSTVEYSNYADRVFENNLDSTSHFGTHHYYDDYVPEGWHEMKKK